MASTFVTATIPLGFAVSVALFSVAAMPSGPAMNRLLPTIGSIIVGFTNNAGPAAVADASWILPTLLALVIAVFVADYGQRAERNGGGMGPEVGLLSFLGTMIAAFTLNYLGLAIVTSAIGLVEGGHLIGVSALSICVVAFGVAVGTSYVASTKVLLAENKQARRVARNQSRLVAIDSAKSVSAGLWSHAGWVLVPLAASVAIVALNLRFGTLATEFFAALLIVVAFFSCCFSVSSLALVFTKATPIDAWPLLFIGYLPSGIGFVTLAILTPTYVASDQPLIRVWMVTTVSCVLILMAIWHLPLELSSKGNWTWSPTHAVASLVAANARFRLRRLAFARQQLRADHRRLSATLSVSQQTGPLATPED